MIWAPKCNTLAINVLDANESWGDNTPT